MRDNHIYSTEVTEHIPRLSLPNDICIPRPRSVVNSEALFHHLLAHVQCEHYSERYSELSEEIPRFLVRKVAKYHLYLVNI